MNGLSEERRKEIERLIQSPVSETVWTTADLILALRDLLAESAALRTTLDNARQEIQRLWTLGTKAESAALRAPASPDDLARVAASLVEIQGNLLYAPQTWCLLCMERGTTPCERVPTCESRYRNYDEALARITVLRARLTPPTGPKGD